MKDVEENVSFNFQIISSKLPQRHLEVAATVKALLL